MLRGRPRDLHRARPPFGAGRRERGRILGRAAQAQRHFRAVAVREDDVHARRPRRGQEAGLAGQDRERVEVSGVAAVEQDGAPRPESGLRQRDLDAAALVLRAERRAPPAERAGRRRGDGREQPRPARRRTPRAPPGAPPPRPCARPPSTASASARERAPARPATSRTKASASSPAGRPAASHASRTSRAPFGSFASRASRNAARTGGTRSEPASSRRHVVFRHGSARDPGGAAREVLGDALHGPGGLVRRALAGREKRDLVERVEENRARVASGGGDDRDGAAQGAVLLAAVPARGARRGPGDDLEHEGRARREGPRPSVPVEERGERRREIAQQRVARRRRRGPAPTRERPPRRAAPGGP